MQMSTRRDPYGNATETIEEYLDSWRSIADRLCQLLDATLIGFDPGFLIKFNGQPITIPKSLALRIIEIASYQTDLENEE